MAGDTTFTFLDSTGTTKSARAGSDGSSNLAPAATLYDENAAVLKGQKTRSASLPTAFSTEDAALLEALLTDDTFTTQIGAAVTGQSLEAGGSGVLGWLSSIRKAITDRLGTLGQKAMSASTPVVIASDQSAVPISGTVGVSGNVEVVNDVGNPLPVSASSLPLPSGAATEAKQDTLISAAQAIQATAGTTTGAAVVSDANGTIQQYLRGLVKIFADIWDSVNHAFGVKQIGTWTVQPGNTANTTPWLVSLQPTTSGGASIYRSLSVVATGASVKASAGQLYGYYVANLNASSTRYLKIYDKASAPTVGSDTPVITIPIPPGSAANVAFPNGVAFALGIGVGATTLIADADATAPSANEVVVNLFYK